MWTPQNLSATQPNGLQPGLWHNAIHINIECMYSSLMSFGYFILYLMPPPSPHHLLPLPAFRLSSHPNPLHLTQLGPTDLASPCLIQQLLSFALMPFLAFEAGLESGPRVLCGHARGQVWNFGDETLVNLSWRFCLLGEHNHASILRIQDCIPGLTRRLSCLGFDCFLLIFKTQVRPEDWQFAMRGARWDISHRVSGPVERSKFGNQVLVVTSALLVVTRSY